MPLTPDPYEISENETAPDAGQGIEGELTETNLPKGNES
jgi:hypothetical protein